MEIATKAEFAAMINVTRGRVSQMLASRQIDGDALIGEGRNARINVAVALAQLDARLDIGQRLGANGKANLGGAASLDPTDSAIKAERLRQLQHVNAKAEAEAGERSGKYVLAASARQDLGAMAARMVAAFEGCLPSFADAIAAGTSMPQRDALHMLRQVWRDARARLAGVAAEEAAAAPELVKEKQ